MNDVRIVLCEACQSEGRILVADYDIREGCAGERDLGPCPYCDGTGGEIIEVEPITLDDLEAGNVPATEKSFQKQATLFRRERPENTEATDGP